MTQASYVFEIETCVGLEREAATVLLELGGKVGGYYPRGGAYETRAWPPPPQEIIPHLPAIMTVTASTLITADYVVRIARWFHNKRADEPHIPPTRLRIRRREGSQPLLDVELETADPKAVETVMSSLLDASPEGDEQETVKENP